LIGTRASQREVELFSPFFNFEDKQQVKVLIHLVKEIRILGERVELRFASAPENIQLRQLTCFCAGWTTEKIDSIEPSKCRLGKNTVIKRYLAKKFGTIFIKEEKLYTKKMRNPDV
jgi:hypothetical protein